MATPLRSAQAPLTTLLDRYAELAPPERPRASQTHSLLREASRQRLPEGVPFLAATARTLRMSARTLQRRLGDDELTFQGVVDELCEDLARLHVQRDQLPVEEIAARLGYAKPSAFLRAFERSTGTMPTRLRDGRASPLERGHGRRFWRLLPLTERLRRGQWDGKRVRDVQRKENVQTKLLYVPPEGRQALEANLAEERSQDDVRSSDCLFLPSLGNGPLTRRQIHKILVRIANDATKHHCSLSAPGGRVRDRRPRRAAELIHG
jgi:AraC-like DNA-binding protein